MPEIITSRYFEFIPENAYWNSKCLENEQKLEFKSQEVQILILNIFKPTNPPASDPDNGTMSKWLPLFFQDSGNSRWLNDTSYNMR